MARWGGKLLEGLKKLSDTLHRRETLTPKGYARSMERICQTFLRRMRRPQDHAQAQRLAKRFRGVQAQSYFTFLAEPGVAPTHNATERAIRQGVIDRRVAQGTRGNTGQRWSEHIWTILATCCQQNRSAFDSSTKPLSPIGPTSLTPHSCPNARERLHFFCCLYFHKLSSQHSSIGSRRCMPPGPARIANDRSSHDC